MRRKTSPRPIERATAVKPLVSETVVRASRLPTAAALAAALFATSLGSIGCGTKRADAASIGADDHDRGRVLASNEATAHAGDGDKKPIDDGVKTPPVPSGIAIAGGGAAPAVTVAPPHPIPIPHAGKVAPIMPHPLPPPPKGGPVAIAPKMPGGKAPTMATPPTIGATTTPPCANQAVDSTY